MKQEVTKTGFNKVAEYINGLRRQDCINNLFNTLESYGNVVIIGGSIRDIAFERRKPRDIDIIVDTDEDNLDDAFIGMQYAKNRFGGYKAVYMDQEFDVWTIVNNWAFKSKILDAKVENIPKGCFYNLDATYFNVSTGKGDAEQFNKALYKKQLDIVLDEQYISGNPFPEVNIVRAIVLRREYDVSFSIKVKHYIRNWLVNIEDPIRELMGAQIKHYKRDDKVSRRELYDFVVEFSDN